MALKNLKAHFKKLEDSHPQPAAGAGGCSDSPRARSRSRKRSRSTGPARRCARTIILNLKSLKVPWSMEMTMVPSKNLGRCARKLLPRRRDVCSSLFFVLHRGV